jgi:hypothetical protein
MMGWENFLLAQVGASAALAGLLFVGVSINLNKILSFPTLPSRAFEALLFLVTILILCSLLLVPRQSQTLVGYEVLIIGLIIWVTITLFDINIWRKTEAQYRRLYARLIIINQITLLPYAISGVIILFQGFIGLYWLAPAIILSFVMAILNSWVLLVEINR